MESIKGVPLEGYKSKQKMGIFLLILLVCFIVGWSVFLLSIVEFQIAFSHYTEIPMNDVIFVLIAIGLLILCSFVILIVRIYQKKFKFPKLGRLKIISFTLFFLFMIIIHLAGSIILYSNFGKGEHDLDKISSLYNNQEEWETRASIIKKGILNGAELYPLPKRSSLNSVVHSQRIYGNYSVENMFLETIPGFYLACNLYRPYPLENHTLKPVVMVPHGHFKKGRFDPVHQYLSATLAQLGCIVITYDMVGWGETMQMNHEDSHSLTVQLWNCIRVLDFLLNITDADPTRVGISGASGGGTQTFLLTAVDPRITLSAPVVQVSSWFYGGCVCESGLSIHKGKDYATNNAEIAALAAPRPQLLVSDGDDWTYLTPGNEFPFIQRTYGFYNKSELVENVHFENEEHGFELSKRTAVYYFMSKHFNLNISGIVAPKYSAALGNNTNTDSTLVDKLLEFPFSEAGVTIECESLMYAFNSNHSLPSDAIYGQDNILNALNYP
jgi:uncharacterized protein